MIEASFVVWPQSLIPDARASKILGISGMIRMSFCVLMTQLVLKVLGLFRMGTGHQKYPGIIRGLELSTVSPDLWGGERGWRQK